MQLTKSNLKNLLKTSFGVVISQMMNLLLIPFISRIYGPSEFAEWAIFMSIIAVVGTLSTVRYSDAIVITKSRRILDRLLSICIWSGCLVSFFSFLTLYFIRSYINIKPLTVVCIAVCVLVFAIKITSTQLLIRRSMFVRYSIQSILFSVLPGLLQIIFGFLLGGSAKVLILSASFGYMFVGVFSFLVCYDDYSKIKIFDSTILKVARMNIRYPLFSAGFSLCSMIRIKAVYFFLSLTGQSFVISRFAQTERIIMAPSSFVGAAIRPIFFKEASITGMASQFSNIMRLLRIQWISIAPMISFFFLYSENFCTYILGAKWHGTGFYFQCFIIPAFLNMTTNWLDRGYDVLKMQKNNFIIELIFAIIILGTLPVIISYCDNFSAVFIFLGFISSLFYVSWISYLLTRVGGRLKDIFIPLLCCLVIFSLSAYFYLFISSLVQYAFVVNFCFSIFISFSLLFLCIKKERVK